MAERDQTPDRSEPEPEPYTPPAIPAGGFPVAATDLGAEPPRCRGRLRWWIIGGLGVLLALCVLLGAVAAVFGPRVVRGTTRAMRDANSAVTGYYAAVEAHDWTRAEGYLASPLRSSTSASDLQSAWERREAAYGAVDRFDVTGTNVRVATGTGATATVSGTLHYKGGQSELKIVTLVKEGDAWRLSRLP